MRIGQRRRAFILGFLSLLLSGCPKQYHNLAVASDAVAHSLRDVQDAIDLAVTSNVMSQKERDDINEYLVQVSLSGIELNKAIRKASTSGASIQTQVEAFLLSFKKLQTQALGIKDGNTRLAVSLGLTSAETSVAIVAAFQTGQ